MQGMKLFTVQTVDLPSDVENYLTHN
jgi:hypothetical protein